MPYYADCYILINSRKKAFVKELLNCFLVNDFTETPSYYEIPFLSKEETQFVFDTSDELMTFLENNTQYSQRVDWCKNDLSMQASVFYTDDAAMILSASCCAESNEEDCLLIRLKDKFESNYGYIAYEQPPPYNSKEFIRLVKSLEK